MDAVRWVRDVVALDVANLGAWIACLQLLGGIFFVAV